MSQSSKKTFDMRLFQGLDGKDKAEAHRFLATNFVIERLREIVLAERDGLQISRKDYDNPNWAYLQAHHNGEFLALTRVLKLLGVQEDDS